MTQNIVEGLIKIVTNLQIQTIAQKEILRHLIIKMAKQSDDAKAWAFDLHEEISTARGVALLAAPASKDHNDMARAVSAEVEKLFNEIDLDS
ncbi:hypothetical protein ABIB99_004709 [Bradyrhizobium sp. LA6.1]|uniref:hypothetical protein n=1 Tax=Bradyrhizobium sp. LA6.1 TaxID=3156378 RepID=UPI003393190D